TPSQLPPHGCPIVAGDFNGNGRDDLVATGSDGHMMLFLDNGPGAFSGPTPIVTASEFSPVASADFNGDGKLDLLARSGSKYYVLLGNGSGFGHPMAFAGQSDPQDVEIRDFNGDHIPDLVIANFAKPRGVFLLLGDGNGGF